MNLNIKMANIKEISLQFHKMTKLLIGPLHVTTEINLGHISWKLSAKKTKMLRRAFEI